MSDILADIADVASELADGRQHAEPYHVWTPARNRQVRRHVTVQPGLLAQLYESVIPGSAEGEGSRPHPTSRPPLAIEALSMYGVIQIAVFRWAHSLGLEQRDTTESMLRALVGAAPQLDDDTAKALLSEMRAWRRWCAVMTGWESALFVPRVPCPVCDKLSAVRINTQVMQAFCQCGASWCEEDGSINLLAEYIKTITEGAAA